MSITQKRKRGRPKGTTPSSIGGFNLPARGPNQIWSLRKLRGIHHMVIRAHVMGYSEQAIADALGITKAMVNYTVNSPLAQQKIAMMHGQLDVAALDIMGELAQLAPIALEEMEDLLVKSGDERLKFAVAKDLLDRAGYKPAQRLEIDNQYRINDDDIEEIKRRRDAAARACGILVEDAVVLSENGDGSADDEDVDVFVHNGQGKSNA